jgi:hypothetical protein
VKSNRTATMRWIIIIGLLTSSLLFQQSAHAASDLACNHLGELIRFHFDCCGSISAIPAPKLEHSPRKWAAGAP